MVEWARARREAIRKQAELRRRLAVAEQALAGAQGRMPPLALVTRPAGVAVKADVSGAPPPSLCVESPPIRGGGDERKAHAMRRFRSLIAQSPAIAISVIALAVSAGGGAYASTHLAGGTSPAASQAVSTTGVTWSSLSLVNGWVSENAAFQSGNPKVAQQSGIVYLSGSLAQPSGGSNVFATMPSADRPSHNMWITVYTYGGTSGTLYIGHDGTMEAYSSNSCSSLNSAQCFTSLATVSYPVNS